MQKHVGCGGDLNIFVDDSGVLYVCAKCQGQWEISFVPAISRPGSDTFCIFPEPNTKYDCTDLSDRAHIEYPEAFGEPAL